MSNHFEQMTDEQFYLYLKDKYGPRWQFASLTKEEYERVPPLTEEQIKKALEEGAIAHKAVEEAFVPPYVNPGVRFR